MGERQNRPVQLSFNSFSALRGHNFLEFLPERALPPSE
jgi:hypothetical protein